jgi:hypothetical protein
MRPRFRTRAVLETSPAVGGLICVMERQDDPQLWDLLGHSKTPEPSPFFARNVLRAIRAEKPSPQGVASWFQLRRLIPSFSALAAVIVAVFTFQSLHHHRTVHNGNEIASAEMADAEATDFDVLSGDDDSDDAPLL